MEGEPIDEQPVDEADVRAIVRLLADVAVEPGGLIAQKRRLVEGVVALVDADTYMWNVTRFADGGPPVAVSMLHNLDDEQVASLIEWNYTRSDNDYNRATLDLLAEHGERPWTRTMPQMVSADWLERERQASPAARRMRFEQMILCAHPIPQAADMISVLGLHRARGRPPWTRREARLAHIVFTEVAWLHVAEAVPEEDGRRIVPLSPRLQTVLTLLIDGKVPKEIAASLGLSVHTVRTYIRDIYAHFGVSGRPELLRRFMTGNGGDRPSA